MSLSKNNIVDSAMRMLERKSIKIKRAKVAIIVRWTLLQLAIRSHAERERLLWETKALGLKKERTHAKGAKHSARLSDGDAAVAPEPSAERAAPDAGCSG